MFKRLSLFVGLVVLLTACEPKEITTESGLKYLITAKSNSGVKAEIGDNLKVKYKGMLTDSTVFDSSEKNGGRPFEFVLGTLNVIEGWSEGFALLEKGDKAILTIPSDLAYGDQKKPNIPANSTLIFEVELVEVEKNPNFKPFDISGKKPTTVGDMKMIEVAAGEGELLKEGQKAKIHFSGFLPDGRFFESTYSRGDDPMLIPIGGTGFSIWDEGLTKMKNKGKTRFILSDSIVFQGRAVPGYESPFDVAFDIEVMSVVEPPKPWAETGEKKKTASGLEYYVIKEGNGTKPKVGTNVKVHYTGFLTDGKSFDSSVDRGQLFEFMLGRNQVIKGWDEGVALMSEGAKYKFIIPANLAYGERGAGKSIPPGATLIFDVELVEVEKPLEQWQKSGAAKTTASGLKYYVLQEGSGTPPTSGQKVKVHYSGYLEDGSMFDSSVKRGQPFDFSLGIGQVIKGWDEGIALMKPGAKYKFVIPSELGYGSRAAGSIPPNSTLIFDVELISYQ